MITRTTAYTIDLDRPTVEDRWDAPLTYGDKNANIIQATLMRGAVAATLSNAAVMLYGVLSDGTTTFRVGTVSGNVVTCELDYTFYAVPGKMDLLLQLSEGTTVINTPLRITANVKAGQTSELVSTGEQFSLAELQAIAAACEAATEAIEDMTVSASAVAVGGAPTAAVSDVSGHKHIALGIPTGATGASITGAAISGADIVFTKSDATSVTLADAVPALTGPQGIQGPAGVMVYSGTAITGTSTTPTAYVTGITLAYVGDRYHYNGTTDAQRGNVYKCTLGGDADTALWVYDGNIRGVAGVGSVVTVDGVSPDGNGDVPLGAIRHVTQSLSDGQKAQARTNIGAMSSKSVQAGRVAMTAGAGATVTQAIVFNQAFAANPSVNVSVETGAPSADRNATPTTISTTGFTISFYNGGSSSITLLMNWTAASV